jgi:hypothetical protein
MDIDAHRSKLAELAAMVADLQERPSADVDTALGELTDSASRGVPGAKYAGITVVGRGNKVRNAAATHPYVATLDDVQGREGEGPCVSAAWEHDVVRIDDAAEEQRWPRYCASALALTSIRSVLSFRVFHHQHESAALNFFADRSGAFTNESVELGFIYATHTALAWKLLRRDAQFRSALASRDVIGQAKGMLMERFEIDAVQAFDLLKRLSQDSNTPLHEVAGRVTSSGRHATGELQG